MIDPELLRSRLNPPQLEAVTHSEGPLLILAGAGSGKTRVITHRIAHLIGAVGADPREVIAVTFTNKAAGEMRERVERLVGHDIAGGFVGTFHAFGLRILRTHFNENGGGSSFVIYDRADQIAQLRDAMKGLAVDDRTHPPRQILSWISRTKTALVTPDEARASARLPHERLFAECYAEYERRLSRASALDFDDLLVQVIRLFRSRPEIAERYARQARWLLVDEFQDTNPIQYMLIKSLTAVHRNVCCVGDEDQSIYSFRGADIRNILDFTRDFPDARIVKLEQNYRSTSTVLRAASALISNNLDRHDKTLWTENAPGSKVSLYIGKDDREEADFVVGEMLRISRESGVPLDEIAILYRTNATSRLFEDRLTARNVRYRVVGGLRFYERREIKDVLAWLRALVYPDSDQDFLRVASTPPRGIGARTLDEIARRAELDRVSLHAASRQLAAEEDGALASRARRALLALFSALDDLRELVAGISTVGAVTSVIEGIGYPAYLEKSHPTDHHSRAENLEALVSAAQEHDDSDAPDGLAGFIDRVSLRSDSDSVEGENGPTLMTVHSAKGLEFDVVFLAGLNEDLFPHSMSLQQEDGIEEERRLAYVAITRARKKIVLAAARFRYQYGEPQLREPSRFIGEIPEELVVARSAGGRETAHAARPSRPAPALAAARATPAAGTARRSGKLSYQPEPDAGHASFAPGMRVIHPSFGIGKVLSVSGSGRRLTLDIRFERAGRKRILPAYTALTEG